MRTRLLPIAVFLCSLHGTIAAPAPVPDTTRPADTALLTTRPVDSSQASSRPLDSSQASPLPDSADPNRCFQYRERMADGKWNYEIDRDVSLPMCDGVCGDAVRKEVAKGNIGSVSCMGLLHPVWEPSGGPREVAAANCSCNNPLLNVFAENFMEALPAIGEIGCNIIMAAFNLVVQIGSLAIPGAGEAIGAGMIAGIQAAKLASYTYDATTAATGAFANWMSPCGTAHVPEDLQKVFDAMNMASPAIIPKGGFFNGKDPKWPKGTGKPGDKGSPDPPKKSEPAPSPAPSKTDEPPKTDGPSKSALDTTESPKPTTATETARQCTRRNSRRSPVEPGLNKNDDNQRECEQEKTTEWVVAASESLLKTIEVTCPVEHYPQACAHYYSAIKGGKLDTFTCSDDQTANRRATKATKDWKSSHNHATSWKDFLPTEFDFRPKTEAVNRSYPLECQADEWPPAYFIPNNLAELEKPQWGQLIRWLPGRENGGAAQEWGQFCSSHDGGKDNGQRLDTNRVVVYKGKPTNQVPINTDDVALPRGAPRTKLSPDEKTITTIYDKVTYTRAVFSMIFNWDKVPTVETPSKKNDWLIPKNPCWPKDFAPNDPGFCLLVDDLWYGRGDLRSWNFPDRWDKKAEIAKYAKAPDQRIYNEVSAKYEKLEGKKRPPPTQDPEDEDQPAQQAPRIDPRRLDFDKRGRLVLRDDSTNATRPLTDDELKRDLEIVQCIDRNCNNELKQQGHDGTVLIIPGQPPSSVPAGVEARATAIARTLVRKVRVDRRRSLFETIPAATPPTGKI